MSPRSKAQNEQIRQERRQQILQAAIPLFAANGFSQTGISDVAKAVGVSHGTVFLYFASKEELFRAALVEPLGEVEERFLHFAAMPGSPLERIKRIVREHVHEMINQEGYLRLVHYVIGQRQRFPELAEECFAFGRRFTEMMLPIIHEGQACGELAPLHPQGVSWSYFCYLNGIGLVAIDSNEFTRELLTDNGVALFGPLKP